MPQNIQQARVFFIVCLLLTIGVIGFNLNSVLSSDDVPEEVSAGYALWESNQCSSCHTLYGQGGLYAPDLTQIYNQRGDMYLREFLFNPPTFYPDDRAMPRFNLTQDEMNDLIAMLDWVANDSDGADWSPNMIRVSGSSAALVMDVAELSGSTQNIGQQVFNSQCSSCHSLARNVVIIGPSLYGIATRASERVAGQSAEEYIRNSVLNPSDYVVEGFPDVMAKNLASTLDSDELNALIDLLMTFEEESE